jgi:hypothetical protein
MRHAAGNMQRTANDMHRATGNMRQTSSDMQRTTTTCNATCSMQHAADNNDMQRNMQHAACNGQRAAGNRQRRILEKTIDNRQQGNRQQGNIAGNKATCGMQETPRRRRQNQATHVTDNVHQIADDMQEHASTCEMQEETHGNGAVRNTAQTPHTHAEPTPRSRH